MTASETPPPSPELEELRRRYFAAAHAMQSGVAFMMSYDRKQTDPKHLRVGINGALCDQGGLVTLLIRKGLITEEEYLQAILQSMEAEVERYKADLVAATGGKTKITLA